MPHFTSQPSRCQSASAADAMSADADTRLIQRHFRHFISTVSEFTAFAISM